MIIDRDLRKARAAKSGVMEERLAALQERLQSVEWRTEPVRNDLEDLRRQLAEAPAAIQTLAELGPLWDAVSPSQRGQLVRLLVGRVDYDGRYKKVVLAFHPAGILQLAAEMARFAK